MCNEMSSCNANDSFIKWQENVKFQFVTLLPKSCLVTKMELSLPVRIFFLKRGIKAMFYSSVHFLTSLLVSCERKAVPGLRDRVHLSSAQAVGGSTSFIVLCSVELLSFFTAFPLCSPLGYSLIHGFSPNIRYSGSLHRNADMHWAMAILHTGNQDTQFCFIAQMDEVQHVTTSKLRFIGQSSVGGFQWWIWGMSHVSFFWPKCF